MNNIVMCLRCQRTYVSEEYDHHICSPNLINVKEIMVDYYSETKNEYGDQLILAKGLDGVLYRLVHCKHIPLHEIEPSNRDLTGEKNNRRPNRI